MFDAVLFDMDGVLVDSWEAWYRLVEETARGWGLPPVGRPAFEAGWGQGPEADARTWLRGHTAEEIARHYDLHLCDHLDAMRFDPSGPPLFATLRARGLRVAVVTNTPAEAASRILAHGRLAPDTLVCGSEVARPKPAPDVILEACRRLGVLPARALVVGDSRFDRDAAAAAGAPFAGFGGIEGRWTLDRLSRVADVALGRA